MNQDNHKLEPNTHYEQDLTAPPVCYSGHPSCSNHQKLPWVWLLQVCVCHCWMYGSMRQLWGKMNRKAIDQESNMIFQDWMNCMINCVINQHHQECIDCISKSAEIDEQQVVKHKEIGLEAQNLLDGGFSNATSQYRCECGSCGCERCGTFHCCACTSDGFTDYCRPSCECNC